MRKRESNNLFFFVKENMYRMSERVYSKSKMMEIRRAKIKGRGRDKGRVILRLRVVER